MKTIVALVLVFSVQVAAAGRPNQQAANVRGLAGVEIPMSLRRVLLRDLEEYVRLQREEQFDEADNYLPAFLPGTNGKFHRVSPAAMEMLKQRLRNPHILDFTPEAIMMSTRYLGASLSQRVWTMTGCARYRDLDDTIDAQAVLQVSYSGGRWRFAPIGTPDRANAGKLPCGLATRPN